MKWLRLDGFSQVPELGVKTANKFLHTQQNVKVPHKCKARLHIFILHFMISYVMAS